MDVEEVGEGKEAHKGNDIREDTEDSDRLQCPCVHDTRKHPPCDGFVFQRLTLPRDALEENNMITQWCT